MADADDRDALRPERGEDGGERALELRVEPLGRLVEQQNVRSREQQLRERGALLLAAGEIVRVAVQQLGEAAERGNARHGVRLLRRGTGVAAQALAQVLAHGLFHKNRLRVLRQQPDIAGAAHLAAVRRTEPGEQAQRRGLARAVAAEQSEKLPAPDGEVQPAHDVGSVLLIAEP